MHEIHPIGHPGVLPRYRALNLVRRLADEGPMNRSLLAPAGFTLAGVGLLVAYLVGTPTRTSQTATL